MLIENTRIRHGAKYSATAVFLHTQIRCAHIRICYAHIRIRYDHIRIRNDHIWKGRGLSPPTRSLYHKIGTGQANEKNSLRGPFILLCGTSCGGSVPKIEFIFSIGMMDSFLVFIFKEKAKC